MNKKIEVEGSELAIKNSNGDIAIIPKKDSGMIKKMISNRMYFEIDKYVKMLPKYSDYAENGTIILGGGIDSLIRDFYLKYEPAKNTDEQISKVKDFYKDDFESLIKDFYLKYEPDRYTPDKVKAVIDFYGLKKKEGLPLEVQSTSDKQGHENKVTPDDIKNEVSEFEKWSLNNNADEINTKEDKGLSGSISDETQQEFTNKTIGLPQSAGAHLLKASFDLLSTIEYYKAKALETVGIPNSSVSGIPMTSQTAEIMREKMKQDMSAYMIQREQGFIEAIGNGDIGEALGIAIETTAESIPLMAMAALTGGTGVAPYAVTSSIVAGQTYLDTKNEDWFKEMSPWAQLGYVSAMGAFESIGEVAGGRIIGRSVKELMASGKKELIHQSLKDVIRGYAKETGKSFMEEGLGEAATQLGQDITDAIARGEDIDLNKLLYNVFEAGILGGFSGAGMSGTIGGVSSSINAVNVVNRLNSVKKGDYEKVINEYNSAIENGASPEEITFMQKRLVEAVKNKNTIDKERINLVSNMTTDTQTELYNLLGEVNTLTDEIKKATTQQFKDELKLRQEGAIERINQIIDKETGRPVYSIDGKRVKGKDEFISRIKGMTPEQIESSKFLIENDKETADAAANIINELNPNKDAIQKSTTEEGVLRQERPEVELREMGKGNTQEQEASQEGKQEVVTQSSLEAKKADIEKRRQDIVSRKSTPEEKFEFLENIPDGTIIKNEDGDALIIKKRITKRGTQSYELVPLFLNEENVWEKNPSALTIVEKKANGEFNLNAALPQIFTTEVQIIFQTETKYDAELAALESQTNATQQEVVTPKKEGELPSDVASELTEDADGNYVFHHYSSQRRETIKPMSGEGLKTSREESQALSTVGGLAMYYTTEGQKETSVGDELHTVKIPKEKVLLFNSLTPESPIYVEAKRRFKEKFPGLAFSPNHQVAWVAKVAGENGFDMVVARWNGGFRAQSAKELTPEQENIPFKKRENGGFNVGDEVEYNGQRIELTEDNGDSFSYSSLETDSTGKIDKDSLRMRGDKIYSFQNKLKVDFMEDDNQRSSERDTKWDEAKKKSLPKSEFKSEEELRNVLENEKFGMLTGENPIREEGGSNKTNKENRELNKRAKEWLEKKGYKVNDQFGKYGNSEASFFVKNLSIKDALEFMKEFGQESVALNDMILYHNGTYRPRTGANIGVQGMSDMYSAIRVGNKNIEFRVNYDFDTENALQANAEILKAQEEIKADSANNAQIEQGVEDIFESNPELAKVGSKEQYSEYLDTIFPDSKVKDIVYHGGGSYLNNKDFKFDINRRKKNLSGKKLQGIYLTPLLENAKWYADMFHKEPVVLHLLVNTLNPFFVKDPKYFSNIFKLNHENITESERKDLQEKGYDSVIATYSKTDLEQGYKEGDIKELVSMMPEQIHILGSKQDIEGFKDFVDKKNQSLNQKPDEKQVQQTKGTGQEVEPSTTSSREQGGGINPSEVKGYDRMMKEMKGIILKSQKRGVPYKRIMDNAMSYLMGSKVYERASDIQREQMVRDLNKQFGRRLKSAPLAKRILGQISNVKKITIDEMAALKNQIMSEAKGAKNAIAARKAISTQIIDDMKGMVKSGKISQNQMISVAKKLATMNVFDENKVSEFIEHMRNTFEKSEYDSRVSKLNSKVKKAFDATKKKLGIASELVPLLQKVFSFKPSIIPSEVFDKYEALVNMISERKAVLNVKEVSEMVSDAKEIMEAVLDKAYKVDELKARFNEYDGKITDEDGNLKYGETLKAMLSDEAISIEEYEMMKENKSFIIESKKKETSEQEIADEKKALISQIKKMPVSTGRVQSPAERQLVRELRRLLATNAIESLKNDELKSVIRLVDGINNGIIPHYTQLIADKMSAAGKGAIISESVKSAKISGIENVYTKLKTQFMKNKNQFLAAIERNPLYFIDQVLGDYNTKRVYNALFRPIAEGYAKYRSEFTGIESKIDDAVNKLSKSLKANNNKLVKAKYRITAYLVQLEYESNPGNKEVNKAADFLKATIEAYNKKPSSTMYSKKDIDALQNILDEFDENGNIDLNKMYDSFSNEEKELIGTIQDINKSLLEKAEYTGAVIRGTRINPRTNYVHLKSSGNLGSVDMDSNESLVQKFMRISKPSTKAESLIERTGKVHPIDFDIVSTALSGAREVLIDYNMTTPVRQGHMALKAAMNNVEKSDKKSPDIIDALEQGFDKALNGVLNSSFTNSSFVDRVLREINKMGYRAMLGSVTRASAEFTSNLGFVLIKDRAAFTQGMKYNGMMSKDGFSIMQNVGSSQTTRLFPSSSINGRMVDMEMLNNIHGANSSTLNNDVLNVMQMVYNYTLKKGLKNPATFIADALISTPDKIVARPVWFGTFANKFKELTGEDVDFDKIAQNNEQYLLDNKDAIQVSKEYSDNASTLASASDNPFMGILKNNIDPKDSGLLKTFKMFNGFMNRFMIYEYTTARTGIHALMNTDIISKGEGAKLVAAVTVRMTSYMVLSKILSNELASILLGSDDDEEQKDFGQTVGQAVGSTAVSLIVGRNFGNVNRSLVSMPVEYINKEYLDFLRNGDYNVYKDALSYNAMPIAKKPGDNMMWETIKNMSGAYSPFIESMDRSLEVAMKVPKTQEAIDRRKNELMMRTPFELLGLSGMVPFYTDSRKILMKYLYKDIKGGGGTTGMSDAEFKRLYPQDYKKLQRERALDVEMRRLQNEINRDKKRMEQINKRAGR